MAKIDTLVVELILNNKQFNSETAKTEKRLQQLTNTFRLVGLAAAAVFVRGAVKQFIDQASAVGQLSSSLKENVEDIQAWGEAVRRQNGNIEGFQSTLRNLSNELNLITVQGAKSPLLGYLNRLRVNFRNLDGTIKSPIQLLRELSSRFEGLNNAQSLAIGKKLGLDEGTIRLLQQGSKGVSELVERAKELGVYSNEDVENAVRVRKAFLDLNQAFTTLSMRLASYFLPVAEKLAQWLTNIAIWVRQNERRIIPFLTAIAVVLTARLIPAILGLFKLFATNPVLLGLIAIIGTLGILIDDFMTWKRGGESALGSIWGWLERVISRFDELGEVIRNHPLYKFITGIPSFLYKAGEYAGMGAAWLAQDFGEANRPDNLLNGGLASMLINASNTIPPGYANSSSSNINNSRAISVNHLEVNAQTVDSESLGNIVSGSVGDQNWGTIVNQANYGT